MEKCKRIKTIFFWISFCIGLLLLILIVRFWMPKPALNPNADFITNYSAADWNSFFMSCVSIGIAVFEIILVFTIDRKVDQQNRTIAGIEWATVLQFEKCVIEPLDFNDYKKFEGILPVVKISLFTETVIPSYISLNLDSITVNSIFNFSAEDKDETIKVVDFNRQKGCFKSEEEGTSDGKGKDIRPTCYFEHCRKLNSNASVKNFETVFTFYLAFRDKNEEKNILLKKLEDLPQYVFLTHLDKLGFSPNEFKFRISGKINSKEKLFYFKEISFDLELFLSNPILKNEIEISVANFSIRK